MEKETPEFFKDKDVFGFEKPEILADTSIPELTEETELEVEYATFGSRVLAYILDVLILSIPLYFIEISIIENNFDRSETHYKLVFFDLCIWALYYAFTESSVNQGTVGKYFCGIKVIDKDGNRLTFTKALYRYLAIFLSLIPFGLGIIAIAFDKKNQGWHDLLTGCLVIKNKAEKMEEKMGEEEFHI